MEFTIIGRIKTIKKHRYGLILRVHEEKNGVIDKDGGREIGGYSNTWSLLITNKQQVSFIQKFFSVGKFVIVKGCATIKKDYNDSEEDNLNLNGLSLRLQTIEFYNFGNSYADKEREKLTSKVMGDEVPNISNYEDDF